MVQRLIESRGIYLNNKNGTYRNLQDEFNDNQTKTVADEINDSKLFII